MKKILTLPKRIIQEIGRSMTFYYYYDKLWTHIDGFNSIFTHTRTDFCWTPGTISNEFNHLVRVVRVLPSMDDNFITNVNTFFTIFTNIETIILGDIAFVFNTYERIQFNNIKHLTIYGHINEEDIPNTITHLTLHSNVEYSFDTMVKSDYLINLEISNLYMRHINSLQSKFPNLLNIIIGKMTYNPFTDDVESTQLQRYHVVFRTDIIEIEPEDEDDFSEEPRYRDGGSTMHSRRMEQFKNKYIQEIEDLDNQQRRLATHYNPTTRVHNIDELKHMMEYELYNLW